MKNKTVNRLITLFGLIFLSACDGTADLNQYPLQQPTHEYEIDTWGFNSEVYEFVTKTDPSVTCVMLMLDSGNAVGLHCFRVAKPKQRIIKPPAAD